MQWVIYYELHPDHAVITRCLGDGSRLILPNTIQGLPVTELGADCFAVTLPELMETLSCDAPEPLYKREKPPIPREAGNKTLKRLTLPAGLQRLGDRALARCSALPRVELPETLHTVGSHCFHYCGALEHMELPQAITALPDYVFAECRKLTRVSLPKGIRSIGRCCFYNCTHLKSLDLPDALESIGDRMLMNCFELKRLAFRIGVNGSALLEEIDRVMRVSVRYPEETVEVVLTEYALEYEAIIQAQQFRTHVTGTGGLYRGCFSDRDVDFALYDTYFYHAKLNDPPELLVELAYDRLRWPRQLRPTPEEDYWSYLQTHIPELAAFLLREDDLDKLEFLLGTDRLDSEALHTLLDCAEKKENVRFVSRLLEAVGQDSSGSFGADKEFDL